MLLRPESMTRGAAAFCTRCSGAIVVCGRPARVAVVDPRHDQREDESDRYFTAD